MLQGRAGRQGGEETRRAARGPRHRVEQAPQPGLAQGGIQQGTRGIRRHPVADERHERRQGGLHGVAPHPAGEAAGGRQANLGRAVQQPVEGGAAVALLLAPRNMVDEGRPELGRKDRHQVGEEVVQQMIVAARMARETVDLPVQQAGKRGKGLAGAGFAGEDREEAFRRFQACVDEGAGESQRGVVREVAAGGQRVDGAARLGEEGLAEAAAVLGIALRPFGQDPEQVEGSVPLRVRGPRDAGGEHGSDARPAEKHRRVLLRQLPSVEEVVDAVELVEAGLQKIGFGHGRVRDGDRAVGGKRGAHRAMASPVVEDGRERRRGGGAPAADTPPTVDQRRRASTKMPAA